MKKHTRALMAVLLSFTVLAGALTLVGILLLPAELASPETEAGENIIGISYDDVPSNKGLLFLAEDGSGAFLYLDFSSIRAQCHLFSDNAEEQAAALPYYKDYTLYMDSSFLPLLCDRLGGIEMADKSGENSLYFSSSLADFCKNKLNAEQRLQLCISFFDKIALEGLSSEDFMFIIEETNTSLSYSVCYDWIPHIKELFCNYIFG
ncbi:MAG: hypothetical protein J6L58_02935 [Clostridia bacterium]|nr:hypothetical protein [Clostridia bacterium]